MTMSGKRTILDMIVRMVVALGGSRFAALRPHEVVPLARGPVPPSARWSQARGCSRRGGAGVVGAEHGPGRSSSSSRTGAARRDGPRPGRRIRAELIDWRGDGVDADTVTAR